MVVAENRLPSRVIGTKQLEGRVVSTNVGQNYEIGRKTHVQERVNVREQQLEQREIRPSISYTNRNNRDV